MYILNEGAISMKKTHSIALFTIFSAIIFFNPMVKAGETFIDGKIIGNLFGSSLRCGKPYKDIKPYISYMAFLARTESSTSEDLKNFKNNFSNSLKLAMDGPVSNNCQIIFDDVKELQRATHNFRNGLPPSLLDKLNLPALPPL